MISNICYWFDFYTQQFKILVLHTIDYLATDLSFDGWFQLHYHQFYLVILYQQHYTVVNIFAPHRIKTYLRFTLPFNLVIHYILWLEYYYISFPLYNHASSRFSLHNFILLTIIFLILFFMNNVIGNHVPTRGQHH
jgi:hypothetical protein